MQIIFVIAGTVGAWVAMLGVLFLTRNMPYGLFATIHYVLNIVVFGFLVFVLRNAGVRYAAGMLTIMIVGILLILELFYWVFVNPAAAGRYLTVADWLVPAILVASTVYLVRAYLKNNR